MKTALETSTMDQPDALIAVETVSVRFGGILAIDNVSFTLAPGELLGLIGPNGAGKTTMLRCITGARPADAGRVLLAGRDLSQLGVAARARLGVALTHQIVRPFRSLSVLDNVTLAVGHMQLVTPVTAFFNAARQQQRARALELLEQVGIADWASAPAGTLPLGALKRLEVARALAIEPQVLLLDEPLAGLNQAEAARLGACLNDLNRGGITMILIEHNISQVLQLCSRLVVLDNGRKIADGAPRAVLADPIVISAYIGREVAHA